MLNCPMQGSPAIAGHGGIHINTKYTDQNLHRATAIFNIIVRGLAKLAESNVKQTKQCDRATESPEKTLQFNIFKQPDFDDSTHLI